MTFTITQLLQIFLAMCGAIITIGGAWSVIRGMKEKMQAPDTERDVQIKKHAEQLDNDNKRLKELEEGNRVLMQSMLALMSHELDGNHTEQLQKAKNGLEEYLINRGGIKV